MTKKAKKPRELFMSLRSKIARLVYAYGLSRKLWLGIRPIIKLESQYIPKFYRRVFNRLPWLRVLKPKRKYPKMNRYSWLLYINHHDRRILTKFSARNDKPKTWAHIAPDFWLAYCCALYETGRKAEAGEIIKRYCQKYGTFDIFRYVLAAKCARENGLTDENIERALWVWETFQNSRQNKNFEKLTAGKTIAVVGNGPQQLGQGTGAEIEARDLVIRFNNFRLAGFEADYGKRTDIWVWGAGKGELGDEEQAILKNCELMIWGPAFPHFKIHRNYCDWLKEALRAGGRIDYFPTNDYYPYLRDKMGLPLRQCPSLGCISIYHLLEYGRPKSVDCYGFSFLENKAARNFRHYFEEGNELGMHPHDLDKEAVFLRELIGEKIGK